MSNSQDTVKRQGHYKHRERQFEVYCISTENTSKHKTIQQKD